ncbi:MAG: hypothetical protein ACK4RK_05735 [Gemmataceae bacterium]
MACSARTCRWGYALLVGLSLGVSGVGAAPDEIETFPTPADVSASESPLLLDVASALLGQTPDDAYVPDLLNRPLESPEPEEEIDDTAHFQPWVENPFNPPLGYTGKSSIIPRDVQRDSDFVPIEDRWRIGFPYWDRYGWDFPIGLDYPYKIGHWWDPYNQNVFKGDYPICGQHTFLNITASTFGIFEPRQIPTPTTPFESTARPRQQEFFGRPNQFIYSQFFLLSFDLFHGDTAAFKPRDWRVRLTPVFNVNNLLVSELAVVNPDVLDGQRRARTFLALEEYFLETKLSDISPDYDFVSARVGSQLFNSDFRGFIFFDINRAVRIFGTRLSNRDQFNVLYFRQAEKDTNSFLNTFHDRGQDIIIANYYRQDFIWPGYTSQLSFHFNNDPPSFKFDKNDFLVRPDPVGVFQPHRVNAYYLGWAGDGHINRFNINHAFYWVLGHDTLNPLANRPVNINAQMAALEVSYDRDWVRFRSSFFWASGDDDINNSTAAGFDAIFDNPNFAGGAFSYWQRQNLPLFGVQLTNRESLLPNLRSSKIQGQSNFVNPGLFLANWGMDLELTPKLRMINNLNLLWFENTNVLSQFVYQADIRHFIGVDMSSGFEYRPLLNNNIIMLLGLSMLVPGEGLRDLYNPLNGKLGPLSASFLQVNLTY